MSAVGRTLIPSGGLSKIRPDFIRNGCLLNQSFDQCVLNQKSEIESARISKYRFRGSLRREICEFDRTTRTNRSPPTPISGSLRTALQALSGAVSCASPASERMVFLTVFGSSCSILFPCRALKPKSSFRLHYSSATVFPSATRRT